MSDVHNGSTSAQLKDDIDSGRTGDKVGGLDPAAAPLGTDEEAGGVAHDPQLIHRTRAQERRARPSRAAPNGATPGLAPDGRMQEPPRTGAWLLGLGLGLLLALLLAFALA